MGKELQHHFLKIQSPLGQDALVLERLDVSEGLSRLFNIQVGFFANSRISDLDSLVGENVTVSLGLGDKAGAKERYFNGHVLSISELGKAQHSDEGQRYQAVIVPRAWSATRRVNCRVFQNMTSVDIAKKVLGEHSQAIEESLKSFSPYTLPYCVQYQESDWDFVCRILANDGLFFFFKHAKGSHKLVIASSAKAFEPAAEKEVIFRTKKKGEAHISRWLVSSQAATAKWLDRAYNYSAPNDRVDEKTDGKPAGDKFGKQEAFYYHGEENRALESKSRAKQHLSAQINDTSLIEARSDLRSLGVGLSFGFKEHEDKIPSPNEFNIVEMTLTARVPLNSDGASGANAFQFANAFQCMPGDKDIVPKRRAKPLIPGIQTATVTGKSGEEIHVDKDGRIKVQFHWDREGKNNDESSCYVRVAHPWAGAGFGAQFIPRVGEEVVIAFLNGDPDQPLVTGAVYNGTHNLPYSTDGDGKNRYGIKTQTVKGGASNYNELQFDDTKGKELVNVQAEKDMKLLIKNDQIFEIKNDRSGKVLNDDSLNVTNNQTVKIDGDQKITVAKTITLDGGTSITLKCGGAKIEMKSSGEISIKGSVITLKGSQIKLN
ncbi:type VI secretion system Vgr family protein [Gallaecimonas pentaromativorans]|uniref:Type VI secretion system secreted protein VgrG n=1 Tax=Gallaecimonas pentaromativorans TaxID=584787 RepID=A0A3N1PV23_9GAMM|nr:type VI secretion system tip protein TssI/VgrG [Gallaecimonas pentaromativorans]ROQ30600.1 type VI secretion system secreted protein VgrG [Gallaecimonas pentaromativorans]